MVGNVAGQLKGYKMWDVRMSKLCRVYRCCHATTRQALACQDSFPHTFCPPPCIRTATRHLILQSGSWRMHDASSLLFGAVHKMSARPADLHHEWIRLSSRQ